MSKTTDFIVGAAIGAAIGGVINYLFGPAPETSFDHTYRSRLDWALDEGQKAADEKEAELRLQFEMAKQPSLTISDPDFFYAEFDEEAASTLPPARDPEE